MNNYRKIFIDLIQFIIKMRLYKKGDNIFSSPVMLIIAIILFFVLIYISIQLLITKLITTP